MPTGYWNGFSFIVAPLPFRWNLTGRSAGDGKLRVVDKDAATPRTAAQRRAFDGLAQVGLVLNRDDDEASPLTLNPPPPIQ